jgi:acyl-CoA thioesterase-1
LVKSRFEKMNRLAALSFASVGFLALIACGGDDYKSVRNLESRGETIICLGDSLTEGVGAGPGEAYPAILSQRIGFPVQNAGRRGDTTAQALACLATDVLEKNPRLVIVLLGGNDFLRQVPARETEANLAEIVRRIQDHGAMVVIAALRLGWFTDEYSSMYEKLARRAGALYIPQVMKDILSDNTLKSDPIHPNAAGYRLLAERIATKVIPLLRAAGAREGGDGRG